MYECITVKDCVELVCRRLVYPRESYGRNDGYELCITPCVDGSVSATYEVFKVTAWYFISQTT